MGRNYKIETTQVTLADAVSNGFGDLQSLRDEMREWADNMESNNLGQTPKFEEVNEAADALDGIADNEPDVPESIGSAELSVGQEVNRRKGRGPSRAVRCGNAVAFLTAAREHCDSIVDDEAEAERKDLDEIETLRDALDETISEAENLNFPGMY